MIFWNLVRSPVELSAVTLPRQQERNNRSWGYGTTFPGNPWELYCARAMPLTVLRSAQGLIILSLFSSGVHGPQRVSPSSQTPHSKACLRVRTGQLTQLPEGLQPCQAQAKRLCSWIVSQGFSLYPVGRRRGGIRLLKGRVFMF